MSKKILIFIILFFLLFGAGIFLYFHFKDKNSPPTNINIDNKDFYIEILDSISKAPLDINFSVIYNGSVFLE